MTRTRISRTRDEILQDVTIKNGYVWTTCHNCGGSGNYPSSMIPAGRCRLYCWEKRTPETFGKLAVPIDKYVVREQRRDRREHKRTQEAEARRIAEAAQAGIRTERATNPDPRIAELVDAFGLAGIEEPPKLQAHGWIDEGYRENEPAFTAHDIAYKWVRSGELSDAQWDYVETLTARKRERDKADRERKPVPVTDERITVEGEVLKTDVKENGYGTRHVMTVKTDDGWLVWGTIPSGVHLTTGARVRFDAAVEPSDRDPHFGFFNRPTKAEVLAVKEEA